MTRLDYDLVRENNPGLELPGFGLLRDGDKEIMALLIERKLTNGTQPRSIDEALRMRFLERYHARHVPTPANPFRDTIPF